ncbi:flagellar hook-length control protein FliK [Blastopirellula marina]|uniref:Flagellar hook-length control protein-like C-terminal domain-containing protein n=1 Tax=Blastopirellula marina TaxID=124 RepID=A0A2S8FCM0_9BACT|nr:flagellar hook-length control protein FliK [Blastopirellula marina]PQO29911.1 hypothetical protein C5Y98_21855 [Blastopirellula marina]PTL42379.1 flagellar hook-length control protein FliK [Blastopirellula marina]
MESSSSQSVNPIPSWGNSNRNQSTRASDPMAFFDLIMDSARSSLGQESKSLDPTAPTTPTSSQQDNAYAGASDEDQWHDDQQDPSAAAYAAAGPVSRDVNDTAEADNQQNETDDTADVVELESDEFPQDDPSEEPDQAALDTAAAAGQGDQLLGPPDTLETDSEANEKSAEEAAVAQSKSTPTGEPKATQPADTDQPLDTSAEAKDGEEQTADPNVAEVDATAAQESEKEDDQRQSDEVEAPSLEAEPTEASSESVDEETDREVEASEGTAGEVEADLAAGEEEATAEQDTRDGSSRDASEPSRSHKADRSEPTPQAFETTEATNTSTATTSNTVTDATEAVAASSAATATTAPQSSSTSGTTAPNGNNVTNIAAMLQRGLQRGTLQKSTEGKPTTQLDAKQQIRLINRVARAVETTPAGQSIKIRLNPSELGQLKVEIKVEGGNMVAKIEAENPATRQVLLQHLPQLRDRLAESNINVQQFDVDVMGQQSSTDGGAANLADQQADSGNSSGGSRQWGSSSGGNDESELPRTEQVNKEAERDSRNLNVTI